MTYLQRAAQLVHNLSVLNVIEQNDTVEFSLDESWKILLKIVFLCPDPMKQTERRLKTIKTAISEEFPKFEIKCIKASDDRISCELNVEKWTNECLLRHSFVLVNVSRKF